MTMTSYVDGYRQATVKTYKITFLKRIENKVDKKRRRETAVALGHQDGRKHNIIPWTQTSYTSYTVQSHITFCDGSFYCAFCAYASPFWRGVSFSLRTYGETPNRDLFLPRNYGGKAERISREKGKGGNESDERGI
jgi:hypothetical protein